MRTSLRIGVCFFGITRSLRFTIPSIQENLIAPASELGKVVTYAHFFQQRNISNPRTGEFGALDVEEHKLLSIDRLVLEEPDICLQTWRYDNLKSHGDAWNDNFNSLRNLVHQLHSLNEVTRMVVSDGADIVVFARPDLWYHDSFKNAIQKAARGTTPRVILPCWQHWENGYNDRFAICRGNSAIISYGSRIERATAYCEKFKGGLHAERLLRFALTESAIYPYCTRIRAGRIRSNAEQVKENFRTRPKIYFKLLRNRLRSTKSLEPEKR